MRRKLYIEKIYAKTDQKHRICDLQSYLIQSYLEACAIKSSGHGNLCFCEIGERHYFNDGAVNEVIYPEPKVVQIPLEAFGYPLPEVTEGTLEALELRRTAHEIYAFSVPLIRIRNVSVKVPIPTLANAASRLFTLGKKYDVHVDIVTKHVYSNKILIDETETVSLFMGHNRRVYSDKTLYPILPDKFHQLVLQLAAKGCHAFMVYKNPFDLLVLNHPYYKLDAKVLASWRNFVIVHKTPIYY